MGVACIWVFDEVLPHVLALFETLLIDLHWSSDVAHDHPSLTVIDGVIVRWVRAVLSMDDTTSLYHW